MELKDVFTALEGIENGTEMIAAIKMETTRLSNEAKRHRMANESAGAKTKSLLEALGLDDGDDVVERAKGLKSTLDSFAQGINLLITFSRRSCQASAPSIAV